MSRSRILRPVPVIPTTLVGLGSIVEFLSLVLFRRAKKLLRIFSWFFFFVIYQDLLSNGSIKQDTPKDASICKYNQLSTNSWLWVSFLGLYSWIPRPLASVNMYDTAPIPLLTQRQYVLFFVVHEGGNYTFSLSQNYFNFLNYLDFATSIASHFPTGFILSSSAVKIKNINFEQIRNKQTKRGRTDRWM